MVGYYFLVRRFCFTGTVEKKNLKKTTHVQPCPGSSSSSWAVLPGGVNGFLCNHLSRRCTLIQKGKLTKGKNIIKVAFWKNLKMHPTSVTPLCGKRFFSIFARETKYANYSPSWESNSSPLQWHPLRRRLFLIETKSHSVTDCPQIHFLESVHHEGCIKRKEGVSSAFQIIT